MSSALTLGELIKYAILEANKTFPLNVQKYMQILDNVYESKIEIKTFNDFYTHYDLLISKSTIYLTQEEVDTLVHNKSTLCAIILEIFNKLV